MITSPSGFYCSERKVGNTCANYDTADIVEDLLPDELGGRVGSTVT